VSGALGLAWALSFFAAAGAHAQQSLDVPFVGTPPAVMDVMLSMAKVGPDDFVVDLRCGDGRLVIAAAKKLGARGYGVDLDGALINEAQRAAEREGVQDRTRFEARNLYVTDFSQATVLTLYLFPRVNLDLRPRFFRELKPGTRIVSHEFDFGSWKPDSRITVSVPNKPYGPPQSDVMLWIVPANAAGRWHWRTAVAGGPLECEATFQQRFQEVRGTATVNGVAAQIRETRLRGDEIRFTLVAQVNGQSVQQEFYGRISADSMSGKTRVLQAGSEAQWQAKRVSRAEIDMDAARDPGAIADEPSERGQL
jgi:hypothetical protein